MTSTPEWAKKENYAYLDKLDEKNWAKGWAWEFIRRSKAYRKTYDSFSELQDKYGSNWRKEQAYNVCVPEKIENESANAWRSRAADKGLRAEVLSASQKCARTWQLFDLYDPKLPYDSKKISFETSSSLPAFYGEPQADIPQLREFEDFQHDFAGHTPHLLLVALDARRPLNAQLSKLRPVFASYSNQISNKYKGRSDKWVRYLQVLDALSAGIELPMTKIAGAIGIQVAANGNMVGTASEYKEAALKMADDGYKGLLHQIANS